MRILFLSNYFKPEIAASSYLGENIREAYAKEGFEMVLYTPVPSRGISDEVRAEYSKKLHERELDGHLTIHRFPLMRESKNTIQRAFRYLLSIMNLYRLGKKEKNIDVLSISSTPPINGLMFKGIKKKTGCKIIYNLQDIFPDSLVHTGITKKGSLLWKIGAIIEQITYKNADKIVVISEDFKKNIMEKGVPEDKITIIRNWVDEGVVKSVNREDNSLYDQYGLDRNKFYVCYSGNIGHTQNMDMLLDIAKELTENIDIGIILVGNGAAKEHVKERIEKEKICNVYMIPFQPYDKISQVFSLGDCGLIISKAGVGNNSVPSKTWSIMSAKRPVLASFDKGYEFDRVITEANCGICVQADDKDALKNAILQMYKNRENLKIYGENGRKYIMKNLTREIGTKKWVEVMKEIVKEFN
ncbi:MAG: glycosyltransferase family 4 protein [Clostridia bacterium]|nr:glycosyltransferase family 4 protein [Clostridia bacterium]